MMIHKTTVRRNDDAHNHIIIAVAASQRAPEASIYYRSSDETRLRAHELSRHAAAGGAVKAQEIGGPYRPLSVTPLINGNDVRKYCGPGTKWNGGANLKMVSVLGVSAASGEGHVFTYPAAGRRCP